MVDETITGDGAVGDAPARAPDAPPTLRELLRRQAGVVSVLTRARPAARPGRRRQRMIESLSEVAEAISSTRSTADVLETVVEEAKLLVGADKAVLCLLVDGGDELRIDESAVVVRGRRDQYPEAWWRARIADAAVSALEQRVPVVAAADGVWLMTVPIKTKGRPVGVIAVMNPSTRRFTNDQVELLAVLGAFAGSAIENARLHSQSQYALLADERNRIAKEMHDGLSQSLFGTSLELDVCRKRVMQHPMEVAQRLDHIQAVLVRSLSELRRYIHDLRPVSLNSLGLVGALHQRLSEIGDPQGLSVRLYTDGVERPLPPGAEVCLYRVAQEAVSNVAKHAEAERAVVMLHFDPAAVRMMVEDDGHGFDVDEALARVEHDECIGLKSMKDRVQSEGGRFSLSSGAKGTTLEVVLPC